MITITQDEVLAILEAPQRQVICDMQTEHAKLVMHIHGVGVAEYLTKIDGLEDDKKRLLRKKYARSNKDLFADIFRPVDKVFNSQGGSKHYDFGSNEKNKEAFIDAISNIVDNYSLTQWEKSYFLDKLATDPNGLFFVEHKDGKPYPTYKSIASIYDYKVTGRGVDWVIFNPVEYQQGTEIIKKVRVYDGQNDYTYLYKSETLTLIDEETYPNPWGYVPAFTCSDIVNPLIGCKKSPIYEQVELADEYLRENSIKILSKKLHGFPRAWMYAPTCTACGGTGFKEGAVCPACGGSKHALKTDVSDVVLLKQPESNDSPRIAPDVMGYVVPPIESLKYLAEDLKAMRDMIYFSHWGTVINREDTDKTAFEVALNTQPMQDRLNEYTNSLESTEKHFVDIIAEYLYKDSYKGCSINYGRNYIIKSPNQYLTEYLEEKEKNASYSVLNGKLEMYYNALYANDDMSRIYHLKLMQVEPWVHNTIEDVKGWNLSATDTATKLYYNDWLASITKSDIISKPVEELKLLLKVFATKDISVANNTPLAVSLGVGGTQALQAILSDINLSDETKKQALVIVFGLNPEDASKLVTKTEKKDDTKEVQ